METKQKVHFQISFSEASIILLLIPGEDIKKLQAYIPNEHRHQTFLKILIYQIQSYIKKIIYHNQGGFIPGMEGCYDILSC